MTDWDDWQTQTVTSVATAGRNQGAGVNTTAVDTASFTAEAVLVTSPVITLTSYLSMIQVWGWFQWGSATALQNGPTPRIRRGTTVGGTLIGEATATAGAVIGATGTTHSEIQVAEVVQGLTSVQYVLTCSFSSGTPVLQSTILVVAY